MANPQWAPNAAVPAGQVIVDPNGNVQQASAQGGTTGPTLPPWATNLGAVTIDNTVVWSVVIVLQTPTVPSGLIALPTPTFVNDADGLDPNLILTDMITEFENAAGRSLQPAQVERLLINLYAYRESLVRNAIQYVGQQNLLAYASFPMIDYLGQLLGITRFAAQSATTILTFTLANTLSISYTITAGCQVGSNDGQFIFSTVQDLTIPAGSLTGFVQAACTTPGANANGYLVGQISVLLNPSSLIASVTNTTVSAGGSTPEMDDHLRSRIQAAPNQFSVAGPAGAYRFFSLNSDPAIIDAQVSSPAPGQVNVYVLAGPITQQPVTAPNLSGIAGGTLVANVVAALTADTVRPLTDTVSVYPVFEIDYQIVGTIELYADADPASTMTAVNATAQAYALALASRIQRDIVPSQIVEALSIPGVYQVTLTAPTYNQLQPGQWANCTAILLNQTIGSLSS